MRTKDLFNQESVFWLFRKSMWLWDFVLPVCLQWGSKEFERKNKTMRELNTKDRDIPFRRTI